MAIFESPVWRHYVAAFRNNLNAWAVWWPGTPMEVGDFGPLDKGCFQRIGTLREAIILEERDILQRPVATRLQLGGFSTVHVGGEGKLAEEMIASATANLDISGSRGIFLRATDLTERQFLSQLEIKRRLLDAVRVKRFQWKWDWMLVHKVVSAGSFVMYSSHGSSLQVRGSVQAIEDLNIGKAAADGKLVVSGKKDLEIAGKSGPIALGLSNVDLPPDVLRYSAGQSLGVSLLPVLPQAVSWDDPADPE